MAIELSSLKMGKTSCCKPEKICKKYLKSFSNDLMKIRQLTAICDWHLKAFNAHDLGIQNIQCLTQKIMSSTTINITVCFLFIQNNFLILATWQ